ncbi:MAG: hypothetical protein V7L01_27695 [Nostoc sp.]|uniref:DUF433 domain-containing protein n=1 Tax=Nostoc sp. TaxID=1180 RepID=UPI002FFAB00B
MEFILGLFALCWTEQQVKESYPTLSAPAIQAVFAFAAGIRKYHKLKKARNRI